MISVCVIIRNRQQMRITDLQNLLLKNGSGWRKILFETNRLNKSDARASIVVHCIVFSWRDRSTFMSNILCMTEELGGTCKSVDCVADSLATR